MGRISWSAVACHYEDPFKLRGGAQNSLLQNEDESVFMVAGDASRSGRDLRR